MPGYWFTVAFVDKWGRVPIQYMGFAMMTTLLVILAAAYPQVRTGDWREREGGKGDREWETDGKRQWETKIRRYKRQNRKTVR